jgi:hypothetical protein
MSEWLEVIWTDNRSKPVKKLVCHYTEVGEVVNLPFPPEAVVREPVMAWHGGSVPRFYRKSLMKVGDHFEEEVNQGMRPCTVLAVDERTGRYLYEYEMPNGTTTLRTGEWKNGRYIMGGYSYKALPKYWRKLIEESGIEPIGKSQR